MEDGRVGMDIFIKFFSRRELGNKTVAEVVDDEVRSPIREQRPHQSVARFEFIRR
jgi:hypothetical protein